MRRLIAHIGLHKTGTTAFQQWVTDNRGSLAAVGIHASGIGVMDAGNHRPLIEAIYCREKGGIVRDFEAAIPPAGDVLLTSEWLTSPAGLAGLSHLAELAGRHGMERHAILVVRDEAELLASFYVQQRQSMRLETPDYETYVQHVQRQGRFDIPAILRTYTDAGFGIHQVPYADARRLGIVAALTRLPVFEGRLGSLVPSEIRHENTSLGALALIVCDLVREAAIERGVRLSPALRRTLRSSIAQAAGGLPFERFEPGRSPLTIAELPETVRTEVRTVAAAVAHDAFSHAQIGAKLRRR